MGGCYSRNHILEELKHNEDDEIYEYHNDEQHHNDDDDDDNNIIVMHEWSHVRLNGCCEIASMYTQQGWKGANQDTMTVWKNFAGNEENIYCGVFDGHGPLGHQVAAYVRDALPRKLHCLLKSLDGHSTEMHDGEKDINLDQSNINKVDVENEHWFSSRNTNIVKAFEEVDQELCCSSSIDTICSGTTAVSIVREREHLIIANLGDSRAVLCTRDCKKQPIAVPLTVDLKPDLPNEADRIRNCKGRVFALDDEPDVYRVWLPDEDCPGLAMARAFGDFCLKDFGLISTPQITYRKLSENDDFVVLATDGVWDVLSNKEVVKIVLSAKTRCDAAKKVVQRAVRAWRHKYPTSLVDDCTVVCCFLKSSASPKKPASLTRSYSLFSSEVSYSDSIKTSISIGENSESEVDYSVSSKDNLNGPYGLSRTNSTVKLRRVLSWHKW